MLADRAVETKPHPTPSPRRRPSLAAASWLSVIPGLGQLYNRQPRKAIIFLGGVMGLFFASFNVPALTDALLAWWQPRGGPAVVLSLVVQIFSLFLFTGFFLGALGLWYAALHDARVVVRSRRGDAVRLGRWWFYHR
jgi:TM2 domain-containing membrane protein YozV